MKLLLKCLILGGLVSSAANSSVIAADAASSLPATTPVVESTTTGSQWLTSLPEAQALAKKENKLVLMDFTGSDWCVWCKKLHAETFSKPAFAEYAQKNLVLVELDFPHKAQPSSLKAANEVLMHKYSVDGFPTLVLIKPSGDIVWKQDGYLEGGPSAMIAKLDEAKKK